MWESHLDKKEWKSVIMFLLIFNDLKYGKNSLFSCNGYSHAFFFFKSQVEDLRKAFTKEKKVQMTFLLLFYDFFMT